MYYIHTIASISHQDSFEEGNLYEKLQVLKNDSEVYSPNYKEFIPPTALRRLSPVLRMALTSSIKCQQNLEQEFDAISVGTALGCLRDTEKFLTTILTTTSDFLSPTAFIQSTHNTIGGQISLGLKSHAYNMTHTQNNLSFEIALLDGMLCVDEGKGNVLIGAADEHIGFLELMQPNLIPQGRQLTSGATFMAISDQETESKIGIASAQVYFNTSAAQQEIESFLSQNVVQVEDIDLLLTDGIHIENVKKSLNYLDYSGLHYSASSFAVHIAHDYLLSNDANNVLIVNQMCEGKLGLILIQKR